LSLLDVEPPNRRYGRVFVGSPTRRAADRFAWCSSPASPSACSTRRPHEDPLLLDNRREQVDAGLALQATRGARERLLLQLAAGAATERLYISFPSLELGESRPRVPSFYALDIVRAVTGSLPGHDTLARKAAAASGARLCPPSGCQSLRRSRNAFRCSRGSWGERAALRPGAHYPLS
jgi:hypothetical protein